MANNDSKSLHHLSVAPVKKRDDSMTLWVCKDCGHEVLATERPQSIHWSDYHICHFIESGEKL